MDSRATHDGPAKGQQTLKAFHQTTKSGSNRHTNPEKTLDALLQNGRAANRIHSNGIRPAGESTFNGYQSELQRQIDARRKAAAAAQERQRAASQREQVAAQRLATEREKQAAATNQRLEDQRAEQDAWIDRASVITQTPTARQTGHSTFPSAAADRGKVVAARRRDETRRAEQDALMNRAAAARNLTARPSGHSSLPHAAPARPQPTAVTRPYPRPNPAKQPQSLLEKINADAKRARERKKREAEARREQTHSSSDDITDSQAQREAEENHAISRPPPYQPLQPTNTIPETNHGPTRRRPYELLRTTNNIPEPDDDAEPQPDSDDELVLLPSQPPQGPFSLNSAAGVRAIKNSMPRPPPMNLPFDDKEMPTQTTTQRFMGTSTPKTKLSLKKPSRHQDLLPITASDLKLYQWREQKIQWAEVRQMYSDYTGITPLKSEDTLRTRFRQISKVVDIGVVTDEMCERVINGDEVATTELNRLAAQYADVPGSKANSAGSETMPFKKIVKQTPAPRSVTVPPPASTTPRPTQGGKQLTHDTYLLYLDHAADAHATDGDSDNDDSRAGSPLVEEDCIRWLYYMKRLDLHADDLNDDFEALDDEQPWREYDATFEHVGHANAEAARFIFTVPEGTPAIFQPGQRYELAFVPLEEGMASFSLKTERGLVQVSVDRRLLTFQQHLMPETKEGWVPKTLYTVFVKKTQRLKRTVKKMVKVMKKVKEVAAAAVEATDEEKDSLFGDGEEAEEVQGAAEEADEADEADEEEIEEEVEVEDWYDGNVESYQADDTIYGSLDQANQAAINEWVRLTVKPSSASLDEFACKCAEAKQKLQRSLEEAGEHEVFSRVMEDGEKTVEVFAKALKMQGARN